MTEYPALQVLADKVIYRVHLIQILRYFGFRLAALSAFISLYYSYYLIFSICAIAVIAVYLTSSASNHFKVSFFTVSLRIYPRLELFPPVPKFLIPFCNKKATSEIIYELKSLVAALNNKIIVDKYNQVDSFRGGALTVYDAANLVLMCETLIKLNQNNY